MMTHKLCSCGQLIDLQSVHWLGIQGGPNQTLDLYNCPSCNSTVSALRDVDPELDDIRIKQRGSVLDFNCTIDDWKFSGEAMLRFDGDNCRLIEFTLLDGVTLIQEPMRRELVRLALVDFIDRNIFEIEREYEQGIKDQRNEYSREDGAHD